MAYKDKEKQKAYMNEWAKNRRLQWLSENGPCVRCGSSDDLCVDHIDPSQKVTHRVWTWSEKRRNVELEKCQVLCLKCHKNKTKEDMHSYYSFMSGCRCPECLVNMEQHYADLREKYDARRKGRLA